MNASRPFTDLCCIIQATLLNACLTEEDLRTLGIWESCKSSRGFSPAVWCRAFLHKACQNLPDSAQRVADLLDVRHLDEVFLVRDATEGELEALVDRWVETPEGSRLPGLLWALCTDARDGVHALGNRLCYESVTTALQTMVHADASRQE